MLTVQVFKASPIEKEHLVRDARITITGNIDTIGKGLGELDRVFEEDANTLFEALRNSLPGGTFDRLLSRMLTEKASHFVVSNNR
jgi:hypothetical protein